MLRCVNRGLVRLLREPWAGMVRPVAGYVPGRRASHQAGESDLQPALQSMINGEKVKNIFTVGEFDRRLGALRTVMSERGVGGCVFTSYHNINYYTGLVFCYFGRPFALVVTPDSATVVSAGVDGGQPWRRSHAPNNITYTDWQKDNFYLGVQKALGDISSPLGLEFDHLSVDLFNKYEVAFPKVKKVDVGEATMRLRLIKSAEEVAVVKEGARIADLGGAAGVGALEEGVPEYEVALAATRAMVREIAATYPESDIMDTWSWCQSGINTDGAHNPVTSRRVQRGDILSLNCFPMIQGYYAALERTLFLGEASSDHLRLWEINCTVHRRGLELLRPGARCCDVARELNEIYREHNLLQYRSFGYGHSFGTLCHYYGREAGLELREDVDTVLVPGMVVSMEPMIMVPEGQPGSGGYREHDILVITEDGAENITKFPYGPEHNVIKK